MLCPIRWHQCGRFVRKIGNSRENNHTNLDHCRFFKHVYNLGGALRPESGLLGWLILNPSVESRTIQGPEMPLSLIASQISKPDMTQNLIDRLRYRSMDCVRSSMNHPTATPRHQGKVSRQVTLHPTQLRGVSISSCAALTLS